MVGVIAVSASSNLWIINGMCPDYFTLVQKAVHEIITGANIHGEAVMGEKAYYLAQLIYIKVQ